MEHDLAFAKTGRSRASRRTGRTAALWKAMAGGAVQTIYMRTRANPFDRKLSSVRNSRKKSMTAIWFDQMEPSLVRSA